MTIKVTYVPSIVSDVQGISAKFDGERVSYNGEFYLSEPKTIEYSIGDGFGVLKWNDADVDISAEVRKGAKTNRGKVTDVRIRVASQETTWNESGFDAVIPEVKIDGAWRPYYAVIPIATEKKIRKESDRIIGEESKTYIRETVRQRVRNEFKSSRREIVEFCNQQWGDLSAKEAVKIGLEAAGL